MYSIFFLNNRSLNGILRSWFPHISIDPIGIRQIFFNKENHSWYAEATSFQNGLEMFSFIKEW